MCVVWPRFKHRAQQSVMWMWAAHEYWMCAPRIYWCIARCVIVCASYSVCMCDSRLATPAMYFPQLSAFRVLFVVQPRVSLSWAVLQWTQRPTFSLARVSLSHRDLLCILLPLAFVVVYILSATDLHTHSVLVPQITYACKDKPRPHRITAATKRIYNNTHAICIRRSNYKPCDIAI